MTVHINDLTFKCIIGILPKERVKKQTVLVDVIFDYKFKKNNFIDYSKITALIKKTMKKKKFFLIEDALIFLENKIKNNHKLDNLQIKISKPTILSNCNVAVSKK